MRLSVGEVGSWLFFLLSCSLSLSLAFRFHHLYLPQHYDPSTVSNITFLALDLWQFRHQHVGNTYMQIVCTLYYDVTTLANVPVLIIILQKMTDPEQKGHPSVMVSAQFVATVFQRVAVVSS